jgi:nitronate monooxygenase
VFGRKRGRDNAAVVVLLKRLGLELPIVQASMGGGLAGAELAEAVSAAGGLGTIGILEPDDLRREVAAVRRRTDGPLAINLLLPFARRGHVEAASEADVVVISWGRPRRRTAKVWIHSAAPSRRRGRLTMPELTRSSPRASRPAATCAEPCRRSSCSRR